MLAVGNTEGLDEEIAESKVLSAIRCMKNWASNIKQAKVINNQFLLRESE